MSLYQFFTSHEPNYIHKSIYVSFQGRWEMGFIKKPQWCSHIP